MTSTIGRLASLVPVGLAALAAIAVAAPAPVHTDTSTFAVVADGDDPPCHPDQPDPCTDPADPDPGDPSHPLPGDPAHPTPCGGYQSDEVVITPTGC